MHMYANTIFINFYQPTQKEMEACSHRKKCFIFSFSIQCHLLLPISSSVFERQVIS